MAEHEINIGAHVKSKDGKDLGKIAKLIVHPSTRSVDGFLLGKGHFTTPKIVEAGLVTSTDSHGIVLSIDAAEAEKLPNLIEEQLLRAPGTLTYAGRFGGMADIGGTGDKWVLRGSGGGDYPHTGTAPFFYVAPIGNVEAQNISSMPEDTFAIDEGVEVISFDGKKIGKIDEVFVDDDRKVTAVLVKSGWLFKHDVRIPLSAIAGAAHDHIRLNITAEEAERGSAAAQGA
jgi:uncharacterized protein YrrD